MSAQTAVVLPIGGGDGSTHLQQTLDIEASSSTRVRQPSRVLHFSDGIVEEFSDSDEGTSDETVDDHVDAAIDESQMPWGPWLRLKTVAGAGQLLEHCESAGEALASFLGITTPKYAYELDVYRRMQAERARLDAEDAEVAVGDWTAVRQQDEVRMAAGDGPVVGQPAAADGESVAEKY